MSEFLSIQIPMDMVRAIEEDLTKEGWRTSSFFVWPMRRGDFSYAMPLLILTREKTCIE